MEIKYADNVTLTVEITDQMVTVDGFGPYGTCERIHSRLFDSKKSGNRGIDETKPF